MKKTLGAVLLFLVSTALRSGQINPLAHMELARLKMSLNYIRAIKTFRQLFLSLLGIGACLVLLAVGLVLFHVTLFLYAPWGPGTKCAVGLLCSVIYLATTLVIFYKIFSSDNWLKIFNADTIADHLHTANHDQPDRGFSQKS